MGRRIMINVLSYELLNDGCQGGDREEGHENRIFDTYKYIYSVMKFTAYYFFI